MMNITLKRTDYLEDRILGILTVKNSKGKSLSFTTLEPPDKNNMKNSSCIPAGTYRIKPRMSPKMGLHWLLLDVPGRDLILIHVGNYPRDTQGCILIGTNFKDIDKDTRLEVVNSKAALKEFNNLLKNEKDLNIEIKE